MHRERGSLNWLETGQTTAALIGSARLLRITRGDRLKPTAGPPTLMAARGCRASPSSAPVTPTAGTALSSSGGSFYWNGSGGMSRQLKLNIGPGLP